jgi:hypothetical protein
LDTVYGHERIKAFFAVIAVAVALGLFAALADAVREAPEFSSAQIPHGAGPGGPGHPATN